VTRERIQRRLAAVLAADVAGYSRLMGIDERGTLEALKAHRREVVDPAIAAHHGRIVKTTGDGLLVEFASAVDAVTCAMAVQQKMAERESSSTPAITFRIGINIGDIIIDDDDIFGDGVNVAARVESECQPGGVCLSGSAYEQVRGKTAFDFDDLGERSLKNIDRPVRLYAARTTALPAPASVKPQVDPTKPLALPDRPSIAVLPFQNMSGDPEQEYFVDGVAEDVLTILSKIPELLVIARNSSFVFKGQARDIRDVGRILGVRYVLEGSVRRAGKRVRLTAQLIDSTDGRHVWADRFEGELDDVFELQDRITQEIASALEVQLTFGEEMRIWRKRSGSPLAYEHFLKGRNFYINFGRNTHVQARLELGRAIEVNPVFTPALALLAFTLTDQIRFGWDKSEPTSYETALKYAELAVASDPTSHHAYVSLGYVRLFQRRHDDALAAGEKAIVRGPSCADAYHVAGMFLGYAGDFRKSSEYQEQAQRLSPIARNESMVDEARAKFHLGKLAAARDVASRVLVDKPHWLTAETTLAAALWKLGREDEARATVRKMLANHPNLTASRWAQGLPYRNQSDLDALMTPLRQAGMPD
jgi:adenylate cyclase